MLTGKDIYQCYANIHEVTVPLAWDCLAPVARRFYEEVAENVNTKHLAPLEQVKAALERHLTAYQQALLTPDVKNNPRRAESITANYTALEAVLLDLPDQGTLRPVYTVHNCEIAERQIAELEKRNEALAGLVRDWRQLAADGLALQSAAEHNFWDMRWAELEQQTKELLGEQTNAR